jgi:hypothetical protein
MLTSHPGLDHGLQRKLLALVLPRNEADPGSLSSKVPRVSSGLASDSHSAVMIKARSGAIMMFHHFKQDAPVGLYPRASCLKWWNIMIAVGTQPWRNATASMDWRLHWLVQWQS